MILDKNISLKDLSEIHHDFVRSTRQTLLRELKILVQISITIDQINTKNFFNQLSPDKSFVFYKLGEIMSEGVLGKNSLIMILDHELIYGLIDKLTGGQAKKSAVLSRKKDLTKLELKMLSNLMEEIKDHLEKALNSRMKINFGKSEIKSDSHFIEDEIGTSQCIVLHHWLEFAEIKGDLIVIYPDKRSVEHNIKLS